MILRLSRWCCLGGGVVRWMIEVEVEMKDETEGDEDYSMVILALSLSLHLFHRPLSPGRSSGIVARQAVV